MTRHDSIHKPRRRIPLIWLAVMVILGTPGGIRAQDCVDVQDPVMVELPAGVQQVEGQTSFAWDDAWEGLWEAQLIREGDATACTLAQVDTGEEAPTIVIPIDLSFPTSPGSQYEAIVILTDKPWGPNGPVENVSAGRPPEGLDDGEGEPLARLGVPVVRFDGRVPDTTDVREIRVGAEWTYRRIVSGGRDRIEVKIVPVRRWFEFDRGFGDASEWYSYDRGHDLRIILRKVPLNCWMKAEVSGGSSAGTYTGDVAVLGNPTGVSDDTLDMWFGSPEDAGENPMLEAFEDAINSQAGEQAMQGMTEEQMEQLQQLYRNMGTARDPIREVRETVMLTLEDVRFDTAPPNTAPQALMRMMNHFVVAAKLAGGIPEEHDLAVESWVPTVESVGGQSPGLGLFGTDSDCGAPSAAPTLAFGLCGSQDNQEPAVLGDQGGLCGDLFAVVFNEQCQELRITASFRAGWSVEQCLR